MVKFLDLASQDKILLALATLMGYRDAEEIADWINRAVDYYGRDETFDIRERSKRSTGTIKNVLSVMLSTRHGRQRGSLLEMRRKGRKAFYRVGRDTADTRLSALVLMLLLKTYEANNRILTEEHASQILQNRGELVHQLMKGHRLTAEQEWLMDEIFKEGEDLRGGVDKLYYILKADYFRKNTARGTIEPTDRLQLKEKEYIKALIDLLPEIKEIQLGGETFF